MTAIKPRSVCLLVAAAISLWWGHAAVAQSEVSSGKPVWTVDLIRTFPGMQDEYLRNIEVNWAGARAMARERGVILSYRALAAEPDSIRGWDIILMTEYADSTAWANREEAFKAIFDAPDYVRFEPSRPSAELREFTAGGVVTHSVAPPPGAAWAPRPSTAPPSSRPFEPGLGARPEVPRGTCRSRSTNSPSQGPSTPERERLRIAARLRTARDGAPPQHR